jgi:copper chaperone
VKTVIEVSGMTCGHCVESVTTATKALDGVSDVSIDLVKGGNSTVTVTHDGDILGALAGAIADEGYTLEEVTEQS